MGISMVFHSFKGVFATVVQEKYFCFESITNLRISLQLKLHILVFVRASKILSS